MKYLFSPGARLLYTLLVFLLAKTIISYVALSSFSALFVDAEYSTDTVVELFFAPSEIAGFKPQFVKRSQLIEKENRSRTRILLNNHVARKLRIDVGSQPGTVKIYSVTLASHFGPGMTFNHHQVYEQFAPANDISGFTLEEDHVLLTCSGKDPYLVLRNPLIQQNGILSYGLPAALALIFYLLVSGITRQSIPAFNDIGSKQSSAGMNIGALDGIRGVAALLVLGQHSGLTASGGMFGVWLFFCLSGFLLTTPFVKNPELAVSRSYMSSYLVRRIKRIVPMYYVMITILFLFEGKIEIALRHYIFIQGDGHLWSIPQEMFFYLLLPPIMAANFFICRGNRFRSFLFLGLTAFAAHRFLTVDVISLYGYNADLKVQAGIFITGSAIAFFYSYLVQHYRDFLQRPAVCFLASTLGVMILGTCLAISSARAEAFQQFDPSNMAPVHGTAAGLLLLTTLLSRSSYLGRFMKFLPLRAVGVVGFSFYLLHPQMIDVVRSATIYFGNYRPGPIAQFILAGVATYLISVVTYSFIERPFIGKKPAQ